MLGIIYFIQTPELRSLMSNNKKNNRFIAQSVE